MQVSRGREPPKLGGVTGGTAPGGKHCFLQFPW
jgi:hypothetical protein